MKLETVILAHFAMVTLSQSSTEVVRGPVNHAVVIPVDGSCLGQEDGTKCNKKCQDLTCTSILARCFQVKINNKGLSDIKFLSLFEKYEIFRVIVKGSQIILVTLQITIHVVAVTAIFQWSDFSKY